MEFSIHIADWELIQPFRIANAEWGVDQFTLPGGTTQ